MLQGSSSVAIDFRLAHRHLAVELAVVVELVVGLAAFPFEEQSFSWPLLAELRPGQRFA